MASSTSTPDASPSLSADKQSVSRKPRRYSLTGKEREYFTTNLALLLRAAVPVGDAIESLSETATSKSFKNAMAGLRQDIDEGQPLWKALERSRLATGQTLALIRLGEQSGNMVENMAVAAKQEQKQRIFQSKVKSALLYPGFVLGLTAIVGMGVAWFLLPRLSETFASLNVKLPLISKIFIQFGLFLKENGFWAVPLAIGLLVLVVCIFFVFPKTNSIGKRLLFYIPGIKGLMLEVELARFGYLLGTLLQAGLSVTQALSLLHDASGAPRYKKFYQYLGDLFEDGNSFRASFSQNRAYTNKLLPPAVQQMVVAAERSGALPDTMRSIGDIYEEKADISTKNLETVLEPILLVIVAGGVMLVAVAVIMPIYGLLGGLKT